ncbi:MAG: serine hydrolase [Gemmatimonadetes bacterium]|nr:serine hydrolase [Gemmatimonadota bacterium]
MTPRIARRGLTLGFLLLGCRAPAQIPASPELAMAPEAEIAARGLDAGRVRTALDGVLSKALRDSAFPGAIALVGTRHGVVASASVGRLDWPASAVPVDAGTMWDLASLTKVVGLTSALMQLVASGRVDLDAPVQRYVPDFVGDGKERVRVSDLLTHSSGLPAWRPLYKESETRDAAIRLVLGTPLEVPTGTRMVYSDLGAIVLGQVVERVSGQSFDSYLQRELFGPLGMRHTMFRPPQGMRGHIAPTELDPWRQRHLLGEVHDENAARLDGVSSHAGLFSSAADLARFARMLLGHGTFEGRQVLDSATIARFTRPWNRSISPRGLGWETATGSNSGGRKLSARAFGHTGFTGTSIWVDPDKDLFVILLTNRVNPTRENRKIGEVRIALADAVADAWSRPDR